MLCMYNSDVYFNLCIDTWRGGASDSVPAPDSDGRTQAESPRHCDGCH